MTSALNQIVESLDQPRFGVVVEETETRIRVQWVDRRTWISKASQGTRWRLEPQAECLPKIYPVGAKLRSTSLGVVTVKGCEGPKILITTDDGSIVPVNPSDVRRLTVD